MKLKTVTAIFTVAFVLIALGYDAYVLIADGTEATISHLIITASKEFTLIPFLFGFLMGHFYWPLRPTKKTLEQLKHEELTQVFKWASEIMDFRSKKL